MRRPRAVLAAALVVAVVVPDGRANQPFDPCPRERRAQRDTWGVVDRPRRQPPTTDGRVIMHWPTAIVGAWVVDEAGADGASLTRVTPSTLERLDWNAACVTTRTERRRASAPSPRFDDADLRTALAGHARGVIYVWSPHMPLSVDAYAAIADAAAARMLRVDVVLDAAADRAFATRVARERGWSAEVLRVADSVELQFRDVLVHAPTVQPYAAGQLVGAAFPGGHTAAEYGAYLDRVLPARR